MQQKRGARKAMEKEEKRRKQIAQQQEEALWAKRRLISLKEELDMIGTPGEGRREIAEVGDK